MAGWHLVGSHTTKKLSFSQVAKNSGIGPAARFSRKATQTGTVGGTDAEAIGRAPPAAAVSPAAIAVAPSILSGQAGLGRPILQPKLLVLTASRWS